MSGIVLRPVSKAAAAARVLEKAGFTQAGEVEDEHEGVTMRVLRWELSLA